MISLKEAIQLLRLDDADLIELQHSNPDISGRILITVGEVRRRLDMKSIFVKHIDLDFDRDGEFQFYVFESSEIIPSDFKWGMHFPSRV